MRRTIRAAATAAASFSLFAAGAFASEADIAPAAPFSEHAAALIYASDIGVDNVDVPELPAPTLDAPATVAAHAAAPVLPGPVSEEPEARREGRSLAELVAAYSAAETPDEEAECLARATYYESKGEPLIGQLTVAEVILNRASSGRFPSTICGVVRQRGQFSFVRGGHIPTPPRASRDWRTAVAIARIAMEDLADGSAPRALFFHARHVRPGWRLTRVATVGNHVFYR